MRRTGSTAARPRADSPPQERLASVEILRATGAQEEHRVGRHILLDWCRRMIGADMVDTVNLRDGRVMIVDDLGYEVDVRTREGDVFGKPGIIEERIPVKALKPVNAQATALYHGVCRPGTTHQIVGDVAVVWDRDFE